MTSDNRNYSVNAVGCVLMLIVGGGFGYYYGLRYGLNGFSGLMIGMTAGMVAFGVSMVIKKTIGKLFNAAGGGHTSQHALRGELKKNINQAKYLRRNGDYQNALKTINLIIKIDPGYPEAQLLKAQILWEGFNNPKAAIPIIGQVLMTTHREDAVHQRALWLATDIDDSLADTEGQKLRA